MTETAQKVIEKGNCHDADDLTAELDRRLVEDDTDPEDTVSWETIRSEALARYGSRLADEI